MKLYKIVVLANAPFNDGNPNYSHELRAYETEDIDFEHPVSIWLGERAIKGNPFFEVTQENVMAETGTGAIMKFIKWRNEGLSRAFLIEKWEGR
jgi:hypothetical protein